MELSWLQAIALGIIQGLTEFLPISSTAHVLIISRFFGWTDPGAAFTAVMQFGTESAVLIYFRRDIATIFGAWRRSLRDPAMRKNPHAKLGWFVLLGTLPIGVLGIAFKSQIETSARNLWLVATTLIVFGLILGFADRVGARTNSIDEMSAKSAIGFGFGQALALIPGVSRSGATITAGRLLGFDRESCARYAFLLAIPAVLASALLEAMSIGEDTVAWPQTIVATLVAFGTGYLVISRLMRYLSHGSFRPFVIYRLAVGVVLLVLLSAGVISA